MCWERGRHNLEYWSQCDTIAAPETMSLVAVRHHRDSIATPRIGLVTVVSQYAKPICKWWIVGRTATKQNKVEILGPMACFWRALGARDGPKGVVGWLGAPLMPVTRTMRCRRGILCPSWLPLHRCHATKHISLLWNKSFDYFIAIFPCFVRFFVKLRVSPTKAKKSH